MAIQLTENNGGKVLKVQVSGKLLHEDYRQFVREFERLVKENGKLRIFFEMADFHGWAGGVLWDAIKFDLKYFADIECLAMLGTRSGRRA
jgi:hypothetical protein